MLQLHRIEIIRSNIKAASCREDQDCRSGRKTKPKAGTNSSMERKIGGIKYANPLPINPGGKSTEREQFVDLVLGVR